MTQNTTLHNGDLNLIQKISAYKEELNILNQKRDTLKTELNRLEGQIEPYTEQILASFGTTDITELTEIANRYIKRLDEMKLNGDAE